MKSTLIEGDIKKSLIRFTIPIALSLLLQTLYSAVDLFIVGQFASVSDVAGVTSSSQLLSTLTNLCAGFAMGSTILIAKRVGERNVDRVRDSINNTIIFFICFSLLITLIFAFFNEFFTSMLSPPDEAYLETKDYLFYASLGIPLIFFYNVLGAIFRGLGDSKTPLIAVAVACFINILLDILFVAVFGMGAKGAAIATVLSQGISVLYCLFFSKNDYVNISSFKNLKLQKKVISSILVLGTPIAIQSVMTSFSFLFITIIVNTFNDVSLSSAVGISEKLCGFIMLLPMSFMQSISAYVAQNMGANQFPRAKKAFYLSFKYSFMYGFVMFLVSMFFGNYLAMVFTKEASVISATAVYLKAYSFDVLCVPIIFCFSGYFTGLGKTKLVSVLSLFASIVLRMPLAYLLSRLFPQSIFYMGLAIPMSTIVGCVMMIYIYKTRLNTLEKIQKSNSKW